MENYKWLTSPTYLYMVAHYDSIIHCNFSELSKKIGVSRKIISKEYQSFIQEKDWYCKFDIVDFHNEIDNKYLRAVAILKDIRPDIVQTKDIAKALGISVSTLYNAGYTIK